MSLQTPSLVSLSLYHERPRRADDVGWGDAPSAYRDHEVPMAYAMLMRRLDQGGGEFRGGADAALWAAFDEARDLTGAPRPRAPRAWALAVRPETLRANAAAFEKLIEAEGPTPTLRYARSLLIDDWTAKARARPNAKAGVVSTFFLYVYNATVGGLGYGAGSVTGGLDASDAVHARDLERLLDRLRGATAPGLSALHSLAFEPDAQLLSVADPQLAALAFERLSAPEWWATRKAVHHWSMRAIVLVRALVDLLNSVRVNTPEDAAGAEAVTHVRRQQEVGLSGSQPYDLRMLAFEIKHGSQLKQLRRDPYALVAAFRLISQWAGTEYAAIHPMDPTTAPEHGDAQYAGVLYRLHSPFATTSFVGLRLGTETLGTAANNAGDLMRELHALVPALGPAAHTPPEVPLHSTSPYPWILALLLRSPLLLTRGAMLLVLNAFGDTAAPTDAAEEAYNNQVWPRAPESDRAWALERRAELLSLAK